MGNNDHWVSRRSDGKWQDKKVGTERASSVHDTQAEAWDAAKDRARRDHTEAFLTGRDGRIRERNTYGNDPFPPRG